MLLRKLIIAEDDDSVAHLVSATLGDAGFLCLRARDGEEALDLVRTELPDLLVLDVMMPKVDGIRVCTKLKGDLLLSRIPILMLTALAGVNDRVAGLDAGADDYLPKPFDMRELVARVRALIRQSRRERDRNPITNLPSSQPIEEKLGELLRSKTPFALLYIDIENFRSFADAYGFRKAEEILSRTASLILMIVRAATDPPAFVGHVGGDDFVVVCQPHEANTLHDEIALAFLDAAPAFYSDEDRQRGYVSVTGSLGEVRHAELMTPSVAVVQVDEHTSCSTMEELADEISLAKSRVRKRTGSGVFPQVFRGAK
jgi:diguanylate cyclase (GGDEF)-like protein